MCKHVDSYIWPFIIKYINYLYIHCVLDEINQAQRYNLIPIDQFFLTDKWTHDITGLFGVNRNRFFNSLNYLVIHYLYYVWNYSRAFAEDYERLEFWILTILAR